MSGPVATGPAWPGSDSEISRKERKGRKKKFTAEALSSQS